MPILLIDTNDKLEAVRGSAADLDTYGCGIDRTVSGDTYAAFKELHNYASAATADIVAAPGSSGVERSVLALNMRNKHATLPIDVTAQFNDNGTVTELYKASLQPGEVLAWTDDIGWNHYKQTKLYALLRVAGSDYVNATTSFSDITGLTCPVQSGKHYNFTAHLYNVNNASTTGSRFAVNGPSMTGMIAGDINVYTPGATAGVFAAGSATALDTALEATTTGSTSVRLSIVSGWINPSADGTFAIRGASEIAVAAGLTVKVGSWCQVWEA